ncbi:MAG: ankyrin repeat domain-containing protein, partial [Anaerolineales bacterium]|nr:ankyrin repeat domain-containing protein [Anaerolineales bacterium]
MDSDKLAKWLNTACGLGKEDIVKLFLQRPEIDVNQQGDLYGPALNTAVRYRHIEIVQLLLDAGANPNINSPNYVYYGRPETPLDIACDKGYTEIVRLLLEKGASMEVQNIFDRTVLEQACRLQNLPTDGNVPRSRGGIDFSTSNNLEIIQILLDHGAIVTAFARDELRNIIPTLLRIAIDNPTFMVDMLGTLLHIRKRMGIEMGNIMIRSNNGNFTLLQYAIQ